MHDWPTPDSGEIPTPELVAAWATLQVAAADRIPLWAAHWLAQGYDGEALRTLAGLSGADSREVNDVLPAALADCAATIPSSEETAARVAFTELARVHADCRATERWILERVCEIVSRSGYAISVIALPLGQIFDFADEWGAGWGRTPRELELEIQKACSAQLAAGEH
ncbi:hypothetical protein AB0H34_13200 [Saccharopolyspora shandongensis]|uniref:hypothetical protein n=1 Tax=Saccharopolyspora shandongensis TaxID=418495 RepID=UPI0033EB4570